MLAPAVLPETPPEIPPAAAEAGTSPRPLRSLPVVFMAAPESGPGRPGQDLRGPWGQIHADAAQEPLNPRAGLAEVPAARLTSWEPICYGIYERYVAARNQKTDCPLLGLEWGDL